MLKLCFKIWALANLLVFVVCLLLSLPHAFVLGLYALLYSAVFSLPAVPLLFLVLKFLRFARSGIVFSWIVLLLGTAAVSFLAYVLFTLATNEPAEDKGFILPLSFVSGYSAVVFFSPALHYLFQTFQYGHHEND